MRLKLIAILLLFLPFGVTTAQGTTPTEAAAIAAARADHSAYTLPPALLAKAVALQHIDLAFQFAGALWSLLVLLLLLELGIAARMRNVAINLTKKRRGRDENRWAQCAIFVLQLAFLLALASLPLRIYGHTVGLSFRLSVQGWGSWLGDYLKSLVLELVIGIPLVYLLFWRIRRSPRQWWLQFAGCIMLLSVGAVFATPYVIDPLFNRFEPLGQTSPALVARLETVVARGGIAIPPDRMYLMKASEKLTVLNAYVTGFGASKRVVVWDTTIAKATPEEIEAIFGHEMGHYVLGHVTEGLWLSLAGILISFFLGFHLFRWLLARFGARWKIPAQEHWGALVILLLVAQLLSFVSAPVANALSRHIEHNADVYGQEVIHGIVADPAKTSVEAFQLEGETSLDDPEPSPLDFWFDTHPTTQFRAAFAKHYDPWVAGAEPKYFKK